MYRNGETEEEIITMKYDVILAGVGGQGVLSIATILGYAAVESGLHLKQAEVHGMSQRGGAVESHLRISDGTVFSDLIPFGSADLIISMEPMETLRYLPYLSARGAIVAERCPVVNIPNYPDLNRVIMTLERYPHAVLVDAETVSRELRASRASNMVLLGAASRFVPLEAGDLEAAIAQIFGRKGQTIVEQNINAFRRGRAMAEVVH
jgi:indolepyruvate ferredoxin oxidoreductase beta subunit